MAFALFLVYLVLSYVRPWELTESLRDMPIIPIASFAALGATLFRVFLGRGPTSRSPQAYFVLLFLAWVLFSFPLATRWFGGVPGVIERLQTPVLVFFLAFLNIDTVSKFKATAATLALLALFLVGQGIAAFHFGYQAELLLLVGRSLAEEGEAEIDVDDEAARAPMVRVRSVGTLADPNDLAQALLSISPLLVAFRRPGRPLRNAIMVWAPLAAILYAIALAKSRGALLAILALLFFGLKDRVGRTMSLALAVGAVAVLIGLGLTGGRAIEMDDSSEGRVVAWAGGLQMLWSSPVWGVGVGEFSEVNRLAAHNSYVNCFSETGFVGYFLWLFLVALTLKEVEALAKLSGGEAAGEDLAPWGHAVHLSLVGFLTAAMFLSRTYSSVLFLLLGLGAALADIARRRGIVADPTPLSRWIPRIVALEVGSVMLVKAMVTVLT